MFIATKTLCHYWQRAFVAYINLKIAENLSFPVDYKPIADFGLTKVIRLCSFYCLFDAEF